MIHSLASGPFFLEKILDFKTLVKEKFGSQASIAKHLGVSQGYVSLVLKGTKNPSKEFLKALNLKKVVTYETVKGK